MNNLSLNSIVSNRQWSVDKIIRIGVLIVIMCGTLIGNSYVILELYCRRRQHLTRLHTFILNLAIGDLAVCLCTMTSELFLLIFDQEWILGNVACKLTLYIQVVTLASTTFINVAMTYDRYDAICCPFRSYTALGRIRRIIILCWLSSFIIAIPQLLIFEQSSILGKTGKYRCASTGYIAEWQRRVYFTIFTCYVLVIPAVCMTIWYVKIIRTITSSTKIWIQRIRGQTTTSFLSSPASSPAKIKTVKLALIIIIVFVACWTPYMIVTLIEIYSNGQLRLPSWFDGVLQSISLVQSSLNPFIYITFNHRRKSSPTIVLAAARSNSQHSRQTKGSLCSGSIIKTSFRSTGRSRTIRT